MGAVAFSPGQCAAVGTVAQPARRGAAHPRPVGCYALAGGRRATAREANQTQIDQTQTDTAGESAAYNIKMPPPETNVEVGARYAAIDAEQAAAIAAVKDRTAIPEQQQEVREYGPGTQ